MSRGKAEVALGMRPRGRIFYGWWVVLASAVMALYSGGVFFYGFTAFFTPITKHFGWSRAATSLAFSLQRLEGGFVGPVVGFLTDKTGPRNIMLLGSLVTGAGFFLLSRVNSLTTFYLAFIVTAAGFSAAPFLPATVTVANWFVRKRGKALGLFMAGYCGSGALVPVLVWLISSYGWRTALVIAGIGFWVLGIPLSLVMRHRPEKYGLFPDGEDPDKPRKGEGPLSTRERPPEIDLTLREAMKTRSFWLFAVAYSVVMMASSGITVHIMPFLEGIGISRPVAGLVVTFITLLSLSGRLGLGWLGDLMPPKYVLSLSMGLLSIGIFILAFTTSLWLIIPFLLFYSPGYGGSVTVRGSVQGEYFGRRSYGAIQGTLTAIGTGPAMAGPVLAGWVFDTVGSYRPAFVAIAAILALGIPTLLLSSRPRKGESPPSSKVKGAVKPKISD